MIELIMFGKLVINLHNTSFVNRISVEHVFSVDIAPHAATFGANLREERAKSGAMPGQHWLGPDDGDLLRLQGTDLPSVDVPVAGPPCPPPTL